MENFKKFLNGFDVKGVLESLENKNLFFINSERIIQKDGLFFNLVDENYEIIEKILIGDVIC